MKIANSKINYLVLWTSGSKINLKSKVKCMWMGAWMHISCQVWSEIYKVNQPFCAQHPKWNPHSNQQNQLFNRQEKQREGKPAPCPRWVQMHTVNMNIHFIKVVLAWKLKHSHASVTHWLPQAKKNQTPVWSGPGPGFALLKVTHSCVLPHLLHIYASEGSSPAPGVSRRVVPGTYLIWTKSYQYIDTANEDHK